MFRYASRLIMEARSFNVVNTLSLLSRAAEKNDLIAARVALLSNKSSINAHEKLASGNTALMTAAQYNSIDVLSFLLREGADVNAKNHTGDTALHLGIAARAWNVVVELLMHGASLDIENDDKHTPGALLVEEDGETTVLSLLEEQLSGDAHCAREKIDFAISQINALIAGGNVIPEESAGASEGAYYDNYVAPCPAPIIISGAFVEAVSNYEGAGIEHPLGLTYAEDLFAFMSGIEG